MRKTNQIKVTQRRYEYLKTNSRKYRTLAPKIILSGNWLKKLGIEIGETLSIIATAGMITIKKQEGK